jgi:arabinogalactan oligomer/maltooligosaccharide transport system substrate-binding protein
MLTKRITRHGTLLLALVFAMLVVVSSGAAAVRGNDQAAASTIMIWTDQDRQAAVTKVANEWGASRGVTIKVVVKGFGDIRDGLKTIDPANAPDVIVGAHDWTGQLAADGLVLPLYPSKATRAQFPKYALDAFSYGTAVNKLYAAPVVIENIGLVVNTKLAKVPTTFAQLEKAALAFKKKKSGNLAIAVPQGAAGDAYHMYPFFSGLGGYVFGRNKAGNLDASDIGVANKKFIANSSMIDKWNKEGLINSKVDYNNAKNAFLKGQAAFWITGPWESDTLKQSGLKFRIVQLPKIKFRSVPFLGVQGFMVTKFATTHDTESLAKDLVSGYMMTPAAQVDLAAANGRFPANLKAGATIHDAVLAQFGKAGVGGVPMPNIPQMNSVWTELAGAWVKSTQGAGATKARIAFTTASRNIANKIG